MHIFGWNIARIRTSYIQIIWSIDNFKHSRIHMCGVNSIIYAYIPYINYMYCMNESMYIYICTNALYSMHKCRIHISYVYVHVYANMCMLYAHICYVLLEPKPFQGTVGISGLLLVARNDRDREAHTLVTFTSNKAPISSGETGNHTNSRFSPSEEIDEIWWTCSKNLQINSISECERTDSPTGPTPRNGSGSLLTWWLEKYGGCMCASIVFTQVDGTYCRSFTNTNASQGFGEGVPICLGTGGFSPL